MPAFCNHGQSDGLSRTQWWERKFEPNRMEAEGQTGLAAALKMYNAADGESHAYIVRLCSLNMFVWILHWCHKCSSLACIRYIWTKKTRLADCFLLLLHFSDVDWEREREKPIVQLWFMCFENGRRCIKLTCCVKNDRERAHLKKRNK